MNSFSVYSTAVRVQRQIQQSQHIHQLPARHPVHRRVHFRTASTNTPTNTTATSISSTSSTPLYPSLEPRSHSFTETLFWTKLWNIKPSTIRVLSKSNNLSTSKQFNNNIIMFKPINQFHLFLLYFLRSSAAFATSESLLTPRSALSSSSITTTTSTSSSASSSTTSIVLATARANYNAYPVPSSTNTNANTNSKPHKKSNPPPELDGHISLRLATRMDVPSIQRCNLATLPENYSSQFYIHHMRQWPDLALVAEHIPSSSSSSNNNNNNNQDGTDGNSKNNGRNGASSGGMSGLARRINPFDSYDANANSQRPQIVGYVLGKVEEMVVQPPPPPPSPQPLSSRVTDDDEFEYKSSSSSRNSRKGLFNGRARSSTLSSSSQSSPSLPYNNPLNTQPIKTELVGHVTSLAILQPYRRRGLAAKLMNQLHHHMETSYNAKGVSLHVRVSNTAAKRLYCDTMGYGVLDVIERYYQDGEDAFLMRKNFGILAEEVLVTEEEEKQKVQNEDGVMDARTTTEKEKVIDTVGGQPIISTVSQQYEQFIGNPSSLTTSQSQPQLQDDTMTTNVVTWSDTQDMNPYRGTSATSSGSRSRSTSRLQAWNPKRWVKSRLDIIGGSSSSGSASATASASTTRKGMSNIFNGNGMHRGTIGGGMGGFTSGAVDDGGICDLEPSEYRLPRLIPLNERVEMIESNNRDDAVVVDLEEEETHVMTGSY